MIEEHVTKLAELQEELSKIEEDEATDQDVVDCNLSIYELEAEIKELRKSTSFLRAGYAEAAETVKSEIDDVTDQIIDEWTGEKKTMVFDAGTLKFRQTGILKIHDELFLFTELYDHIKLDVLIEKYLKGFNLTAVKKYMGVHDLPIDVAEIEYKTTVKLEQKSG